MHGDIHFNGNIISHIYEEKVLSLRKAERHILTRITEFRHLYIFSRSGGGGGKHLNDEVGGGMG